MATEAVEQRAAHVRAVSVTAVASLAGIGAGIASSALASDAGDPIALAVLGALIVIQFPLLKMTGIVEEFSGKDRVFVVFMSFCLWFVTWGILLTTGASV
ncbi:EMC6-like membrane protein [Halalkalicoccus jeotgali]|uniref:Uncharacterized protein n=1 Tax=Halalkalicoccus jeotgali (strain DSM 18796 / CECT 7217 / JCM 14584 / KCTC 4019 / B3) TaxID=795797 RepID=D8J7P8_HALJB|nr:hypothetical protein [Halalkalicoccus jeotgali]ADJ16068.1 hypothetical protein HacjB3_13435 [Halalkalicoccus jeotgali B3]ELY38164.1 hypothetical protein C497_08639 [Halalkalicoccus jeotgali B3]